MKDSILSVSDHVFQRTRQRLEDLTDDEYFWEPVPLCWSVRPVGDGTNRADGVGPERFTTIAWRLWHLVGCYGSTRNVPWLGVEHSGRMRTPWRRNALGVSISASAPRARGVRRAGRPSRAGRRRLVSDEPGAAWRVFLSTLLEELRRQGPRAIQAPRASDERCQLRDGHRLVAHRLVLSGARSRWRQKPSERLVCDLEKAAAQDTTQGHSQDTLSRALPVTLRQQTRLRWKSWSGPLSPSFILTTENGAEGNSAPIRGPARADDRGRRAATPRASHP